METIVIFNMGRDAHRAGLPCVAPESVMYPVRSQYTDDHEVEATLSPFMQRAWRFGWYWQVGDLSMDACMRREREARLG